jgi:hypothetical protein
MLSISTSFAVGGSSSLQLGSAASPALAAAVWDMYHVACPQVLEAWVQCIPSITILEEVQKLTAGWIIMKSAHC